jgi:hypothetical protein
MTTVLLIAGLLLLVLAGTRVVIHTGEYLALEPHRLPVREIGWAWWLDAAYPGNFAPHVRDRAKRLRSAWFKTVGLLAAAIVLLALA